MAEEQCLS